MPETKEHPHLTRNPDGCMSEITATMQLENATDRELFDRGHAEESEIRSVEIEGVVDTGARPGLALPEDAVERLGVRTQREVDVSYADHRSDTLAVVGPINITIEGRTTVMDAFTLPVGSAPLIGQIVLERLDLMADCVSQRLTVPPESPDRPLLPLR